MPSQIFQRLGLRRCAPLPPLSRGSLTRTGLTVTANPSEKFASRPLATELTVDVGDFDAYDVPEPEVVTFALKDFKVRWA